MLPRLERPIADENAAPVVANQDVTWPRPNFFRNGSLTCSTTSTYSLVGLDRLTLANPPG